MRANRGSDGNAYQSVTKEAYGAEEVVGAPGKCAGGDMVARKGLMLHGL
jgi:hypothetical protein